MRTRFIVIVLAVTALLIGGLGVGTAHAAIPDSDISQNTVHSTAYRVGNGDNLRFYGALSSVKDQATNVCYQMQYLKPAGNWTTSGFWIAENVTTVVEHCSWQTTDYQTWSIHDGLDVRGVRFVKISGGFGTNVGTHCNTATSCRNMYQGT